MTTSPLLPYWYSALETEIGIAIEMEAKDRIWFMNRLYEARTAAEDPELEKIIMLQPAQEGKVEIWLCRKDVPLDG